MPSMGYRYMRHLNDDGTPDRFLQKNIETKSVTVSYFDFDKFDTWKSSSDALQIKGQDKIDGSWAKIME